MSLMRLDKLLGECTEHSRSSLSKLIKNGAVSVNGVTVTVPELKLNPEETEITLFGKMVEYKRFYYFMLNKPEGLLSASEDKKQKTVIDLFPPELRKRGLFPVGRLDKDTTGLLLITDDGAFAHKVISPRSEIVKTYRAETSALVDTADIEAFRNGIILANGLRCLPAELEPLPDGSCLVRVREGKYHQVKRMLAARGKPVLSLERLQIGDLKLDNALKRGQFRELDKNELCSVIKKN